MKAKIFRLRMITNLHMGSGESNFNFIDNQVQRDAITSYPNLHSSGLKGALREFFEWRVANKESSFGESFVKTIFGAENESSNTQQGTVSFTEGKLLALPVRSNKKSYFIGTTKELIAEFMEFASMFGETQFNLDLGKIDVKDDNALVIGDKIDNLMIEGIESNKISFDTQLAEDLKKILGVDDIVIFSEKFFKSEIAKKLPIVARNCLKNGVSENLWYEEIVPRESIFYMGVINTQNRAEEFKLFTTELEKNLIQIGANATIGYGFTKFIEVKQDGEKSREIFSKSVGDK